MVILLCFAILVLIYLIIGGVTVVGRFVRHTLWGPRQADSIRLPLIAVLAIMLTSVAGLLWAANRPNPVDAEAATIVKEAAPSAERAETSAPPAEVEEAPCTCGEDTEDTQEPDTPASSEDSATDADVQEPTQTQECIPSEDAEQAPQTMSATTLRIDTGSNKSTIVIHTSGGRIQIQRCP